ncbi:hypothetical protein [Halococcus sp. PRR34]|uniref:hypothetical protein n=1 Tax=Halococcus sp. PRR34 TaxID=3020830 RepID=UPI00235E09D1|nr:hypothetical protein [Halococcus sp. PRR34]
MSFRETFLQARKALSARFVAGLATLSFVGAIIQHLQLTIGGDSLFYDAREVWQPLASEVFGGAALYATVWDNKPPLFQVLNLIVAATDAYVSVFLIAIAFANLATAVLIVVLCDREGYARVGRLAALLFLAMCLALPGYQINPRQFANVGILIALIATRPAVAGGAVAVAGLLTQFSVLAIPVVVWRRWRARTTVRSDERWLFRFIATGLAVVAVAYLAVGAVWGTDAMVAGFKDTFFPLSDYMEKKADESLWGDPSMWPQAMLIGLGPVFVPAALAIYGGVLSAASLVRRVLPPETAAPIRTDGHGRGGSHDYAFIRQMGALAVLLSFQSMIRVGSGIYFIAYAPFVAILAAFGALYLVDSSG